LASALVSGTRGREFESHRPDHFSFGIPTTEPMSIAKRLTILLAVPLLALLGLGVFTRLQLATIEERTRFVAENQISSLSILGELSRDFEELRVRIRTYAVASTPDKQASAQKAFEDLAKDLDGLLKNYADHFLSDDKDRRLLDDFQRGYG